MSYKKILLTAALPAILLCACTNNEQSVDETPKLDTTSEPVNPTKILFDAKCAACHGEDGTAGIAGAANLKASKLDNAAILKTLRDGKGGMPSFKNALTEAELQKLESYVYDLRE